MIAQFRNTRQATEDASRVVLPAMACVRVGDYSTAQGELVWDRGDVACVRVFSRTYVGKRI